jgi:glycerol-3-phosphate dehydrogenase
MLCDEYRIADGTARRLTAKFGTASRNKVLRLATTGLELTRESPTLVNSILVGGRAIQAEVVYVVRQEMAVTIEDVLARARNAGLLVA